LQKSCFYSCYPRHISRQKFFCIAGLLFTAQFGGIKGQGCYVRHISNNPKILFSSCYRAHISLLQDFFRQSCNAAHNSKNSVLEGCYSQHFLKIPQKIRTAPFLFKKIFFCVVIRGTLLSAAQFGC